MNQKRQKCKNLKNGCFSVHLRTMSCQKIRLSKTVRRNQYTTFRAIVYLLHNRHNLKKTFISLTRTLWSLIFPQISFLIPKKNKFCGIKKSYAGTEKSCAGIEKWVTPGSKSGYPNFLRIFSEEFWWISGK